MFSIGNDELEQTCDQIFAGDSLEHTLTGEIVIVENSKNVENKSDHSLQFIKTKSGELYMVGLWNKLVNKNFKLIRNG